MRHAIRCTAAAVAIVATGYVHAQAPAANYPNKPLRLVVGFPAGGPADIFGRAIAQKLSEAVGQQVVVDNRAGAGGHTRAVNRVPARGM